MCWIHILMQASLPSEPPAFCPGALATFVSVSFCCLPVIIFLFQHVSLVPKSISSVQQ